MVCVGTVENICLQFSERQTAHVKAYLQIKHKNSLIVRKPVTRSFRARLLKKGGSRVQMFYRKGEDSSSKLPIFYPF